MKLQTSLLNAAIAAALALSAAPAAAASIAEAAAGVRARELIDGQAAPAVYRATSDGFAVKEARIDERGTEHVRFTRSHHGLPVIGGDFIVHSRAGQALDVTTSLRTTARPGLKPAITASEAIVAAGAEFGSGFLGTPRSRLVVYALRSAPVLAYEVTFAGVRHDRTPTEMHYFVDARTGAVLRGWDAIQTANPGPGAPNCVGPVATVGTGAAMAIGNVSLNTIRCGSVYQMRDSTRGGGYTTNMLNRETGNGAIFTDSDNAWGTGNLGNAATAAVDAHYGVATTWDYFKNRHGRDGIADDGRGAVSRVHFGRSYANAFWNDSCFCMTFGDGDNGASIYPLVVLDIAGHEMSHGITSRSAGLIYDGEPGGLNEATSDIFGAMVEFYAANAGDRGDYLLGEEIFAGNPGTWAIRYMFKPSLDGRSSDCWDPDIGDIDVHYSSGVANHFFYLLSVGAVVPNGFGAGTEAGLGPSDLVCNGNTALAPIGRNKAAKIWYLALTQYMLPDTDYAGARAATLQVATDLWGPTSAEYLAVAAAWDAVSVD